MKNEEYPLWTKYWIVEGMKKGKNTTLHWINWSTLLYYDKFYHKYIFIIYFYYLFLFFNYFFSYLIFILSFLLLLFLISKLYKRGSTIVYWLRLGLTILNFKRLPWTRLTMLSDLQCLMVYMNWNQFYQ